MTRKQLEKILLEAVTVSRDCNLRGVDLVRYLRALARESLPATPPELSRNRKVTP